MYRGLNNGWFKEVLVLTIIFASGLTIYLIKQFSTPLLYYIDGPYYYVQVKSILLYGIPRYPDPPLVFYLLTIASILFGSIMSGVKIGSSMLIMLGVYPLYYLIRETTGRRLPGYTGSILYVLSPSLLRMGLDFIKKCSRFNIHIYSITNVFEGY